ncbi:MAG TPA: preprotein translocase subunit YajC [Pyrinomonadaceae bacterium]|jgi:preprotein translocase subunit YajC
MSIFLLLFQDAGGGLLSILPMFIIFIAIFYFLVIRPQQKQQQQLRDMVAALKINDEVVTNGGIIGRIKEIRETSFIIQSAEKTFLEIGKNAVIGVKGTEEKK